MQWNCRLLLSVCRCTAGSMPQCAYSECRNTSGRTQNISFHAFPLKNPDLLKKWVNDIDRKENNNLWVPNKYSSLCGEHFELDAFEFRTQFEIKNGIKGPRRLKPDAVPTLFAHKKRGGCQAAERPSSVKQQRQQVRFHSTLTWSCMRRSIQRMQGRTTHVHSLD